jgi:hypothetical protein
LENQGLLPKTTQSKQTPNPQEGLKRLYADPKFQALPANKQQAVRSHVYDKYIEPYYKKTKPGLTDQQFQQIRTRFVNPSQAQPLTADTKSVSEKLHDWDVQRDLALGKAGIRVMRATTDTASSAGHLLFWDSPKFEKQGMSPENAKIQGRIGDWINRVHTRLGQAYDEQEDIVNKSLGNEYNATLKQKIVNLPVSVAGGTTEFFAKNPEYLIPEFSGGLLGKAGLSEKLLEGSLKEKFIYKAIKGEADGFLIGGAEGKTGKDLAAETATWGELEVAPSIIGETKTAKAIGRMAGQAADPAIKFISKLLTYGGSSRVNNAIEAMVSASPEAIAKSDPTKVTSSVVKTMSKVGDQVAIAAGFKDHVDMIAHGKGRELVKGIKTLEKQANLESAVHNPELVQMQINQDVKEVMSNPLGAELAAGLAKMGSDPIKTAMQSTVENTKIAAGDLAEHKAIINKAIAASMDNFVGLGPGAASTKEKDVLSNLVILVETNIPMQSKTQTLTFMWGILDQLPAEAKGPLAQKMKEIYGFDTKAWDYAAQRLDDHLDKMIATGHITPADKRGVFHSTKLLGDPTKWQKQLDKEYEDLQEKKDKGTMGGSGSMYDVSEARTASGQLKMGADTERLARILGSSLYKERGSKVVTKELLQNAYDATRELPKGEGVVKVHVQEHVDKGHSTTVSDNGKGMLPDEIFTVFTDLGSSGKVSQAEASGGFGLAKAAPFMIADKLEVETIAKDPKTGKLIQTSFTSTPDDIISGNVTPNTAEAPKGSTTGTKITAHYDKEDSWGTKEFIKNAQRSTRAPAKLEATHSYVQGGTLHPLKEDLASVDTHIADVKIPDSADFTLYKSSKKEPLNKLLGNLSIEIQNNGIYQFTKSKWLGGNATLRGLPSRIVIDVKATVPEGHVGYPFEANREGLRGAIDTAVDNAVDEHIIAPAQDSIKKQIGELYNTMPAIQFKDGTKTPIFDAGGRFTSEELQQVMSNPAIQSISKATHVNATRMIERLQSSSVAKWLEGQEPKIGLGGGIERIGLVFSKDVHGVHVPNITDPAHRAGTIFINPLSFEKDATPDQVASLIHHTIKHEIIHDMVKGHNETFTSAEARVSQALGLRFEKELMETIKNAYTGGSDSFKPQLDEALQVYEKSRSRAEVTPDLFGGENLIDRMGKRSEGTHP